MCFLTNWCICGLGLSLRQKHWSCPSEDTCFCQTGWKLMFTNNRYRHKAEVDYALVEGECLVAA
jgi:hypothetical protein